jgi:hypothetical protein
MHDLAEGRVIAELQISSWPLPVTQTLLHKSDGRLSLTVRGKPSGRLRVAVERAGFASIVVRTKHLRLRTPTVLKMQISWRGNDAVVAAAGQTIGSTAEFDPAGIVTPEEVEQSAPPIDHVDNALMRELRRKQAAAVVSGSMSAGALAERCFADLIPVTLVIEDLADFVRQGRGHHLQGLIAAIRRLVQGDEGQPAMLQFCAGLLDVPLIFYVSHTAPAGDGPECLLAEALDASPVRDTAHEFAIDLDAWLRQEVRWAGDRLPVGWLLRQAELALGPRRSMQGDAILQEKLVRSPLVCESLCRLAQSLGLLARQLSAAGIGDDAEPDGRS